MESKNLKNLKHNLFLDLKIEEIPISLIRITLISILKYPITVY
jgi:hypothetical protein